MIGKPDGCNSVSPYLIVNGAQATIDFLVAVFNARQLRTIPREDGKLRHAGVRLDDTVLMLADAIDGWPAVPACLHIEVADADATYTRALAAGATPLQEPVKQDDADKRGGFRDAGGTTWWITEQIA